MWNLYTVTKENNNLKVAKEIVELIHVEGDSAYVSGTISTGDMVVSGGAEKVIENEILKVKGMDALNNLTEVKIGYSSAYNPAFDITPAKLVSKIICEKGVYNPNEIEKALK